jgi:hypothetical protein
VDLPHGTYGVKNGQIFTITVRRVSTYSTPAPPPPPPPPPAPKIAGEGEAQATELAVVEQPKATINWRYIVGTFAVRIPVTTAKQMLPTEENTYSLIKWRLGQMATTNRWVPVLERWLGLIEGRLIGIGKNPKTIVVSSYGASGPPNQIGSGPGRGHGGGRGGEHEHWREATGKVNGVIYDRFGDFEGFRLLTEEGHEHVYWSREEEIEKLVRYAWADRVVITVLSEEHDGKDPVRIILRRLPAEPHRCS